jgi:hypothetical protein
VQLPYDTPFVKLAFENNHPALKTRFFQPLEKFPTIGKNRRKKFPTIGKTAEKVSNDWKLSDGHFPGIGNFSNAWKQGESNSFLSSEQAAG